MSDLLNLAVKITAKDEASEQVEKVSSNIIGTLTNAAMTAAKALAAMWGVKKVYEFGKAAFEAYAEFEQLEGGIQKLYGNANMTLEEYAASVHKTVDEVAEEYARNAQAEADMLAYAQQGWRTAGMDANTYLQNATSFSASLINSLGGDTVEAARLTDVAMSAISDNVNTFGSDMESVTNAFMGFSRQNYTMLDNLKLGYAGTKEGMQQLIDDANEYAASIGLASDLSIESFADVVTAIELVQEKQGIAGTTMREALSTIEGSMNATRAAWMNLIAEFGKPDADIAARLGDMISAVFGINGEGGLVRNVVNEVGTIAKNMLKAVSDGLAAGVEFILTNGPRLVSSAMLNLASAFMDGANRIKELLFGADIVSGLLESLSSSELVSRVAEMVSDIGDTITRMAPIVMYALSNLWTTAVEAAQNIGPQVIEAVGGLIDTAVQFVVDNGPEFVTAAAEAFMSVVDWITSNGPTLISNVATIISTLVTNVKNYLVTNGPAILQAALGMFRGILTAIIQHAPQILTNVATMIGQVIGYIASAAGRMLTAGIQFVKGLLDGSTQQGQAVRTWFSNLPSKLVSALGNVGSLLVNAGRSIINGFWEGLKSAASGMFAWVGGIADTIANLKGPLDYDRKVLVDNGIAIMYGLQKGLESGFDSKVEPYVESVANSISSGMTFSAATSAGTGGKVTKNYYIDGSTFSANSKVAAALDVVAEYADARVRMGTVREE